MSSMDSDSGLDTHLRQERAAIGADRHDEVWDGAYLLAPLPNNEHQEIVMRLSSFLFQHIGLTGHGLVLPGANVSDQADDWRKNYRCPDVVVALPNCKAVNCGTHWLGGPSFVVEIVSPGDRTRAKLDFYARVKVEELLIIDRAPWRLELYRLEQDALRKVGDSTLKAPTALTSRVVPLSLRMCTGAERPIIEVSTVPPGRAWQV